MGHWSHGIPRAPAPMKPKFILTGPRQQTAGRVERIGQLLDRRWQDREPSLRGQQPSPQQVQLGQRKSGKQRSRVLGQPATAHVGEAPQMFDRVKGTAEVRQVCETAQTTLE